MPGWRLEDFYPPSHVSRVCLRARFLHVGRARAVVQAVPRVSIPGLLTVADLPSSSSLARTTPHPYPLLALIPRCTMRGVFLLLFIDILIYF